MLSFLKARLNDAEYHFDRSIPNNTRRTHGASLKACKRSFKNLRIFRRYIDKI